jgi:formylglycine-generating enzyme required for sulfatase activity
MAGHKEKRVALIIGNSLYHHACPLKNPGNDAEAIGRAFGRLGFEGTTPRPDLDYDNFRRALQKFAEQADSADMAVIYFAGHGIEVNMNNFLIPVDAKLERQKDVEYEAITLNQVLTGVDGARLLRLVILDACRNNPFRERMLHSGGRRSIGEGLRAIEPRGGVLVAYAAKHGTYAHDGKGDNSPYVEALLSHIEKPGLEIGKLFREVRDDVLERTGYEQEPYTYGSLGREDIFLKPGYPPPPKPEPPTPAPPEIVPSVKPWQATAAAAGVATVIAALVILPFLPPSQTLIPDPETCAIHSAGPEAAREGLGRLGCVPVKVKSANTMRELWIKAGGGKEPSESFQDCWGEEADENRCGPKMVVVPAGTFQMGSPENESMRYDDEDNMAGAGGQRVPITFKVPFAVAKFEMSFAQWNVCLNEGGCKISSPRRNYERDDQPAVNVSWKDITDQYLPWLNTKVSGKADGPYRLLSEAEWEYMARAGTSSPYWFGDSIGKGQANVSAAYTMPVDTLAPNGWGLHHVHGNVWEWVRDRYLDSYEDMHGDGTSSQDVPQGTRVVRGGSFTNDRGDLRSARRLSVPSYSRVRDIGFRLARSLAF